MYENSFLMTIITNILAILMLTFILHLVHKNVLFSQKKTRLFQVVSFLVILINLLEIFTAYCSTSGSVQFRLFHIVFLAMGYIVMPVVPIIMAGLYSDEVIKHIRKISIPIWLYAIFCLASIRTGWIFEVTEQNVYLRGPLFSVCLVVSLYSGIVFFYANACCSSAYEKSEKMYIIFLYVVIFFGVIVQVIRPDIHTIWCCAAISLMLYYIFLRELELTNDPITGLKNRNCYKNRLLELQDEENVAIVVLDINYLKQINDVWGHLEGDHYIREVAMIIKDSFHKVGTPYRIGGDEFCVLCKDAPKKTIEKCLNVMVENEQKYEKFGMKMDIAYGYEFYRMDGHVNGIKDISECFQKADEQMYEKKKELKHGQEVR